MRRARIVPALFVTVAALALAGCRTGSKCPVPLAYSDAQLKEIQKALEALPTPEWLLPPEKIIDIFKFKTYFYQHPADVLLIDFRKGTARANHALDNYIAALQ